MSTTPQAASVQGTQAAVSNPSAAAAAQVQPTANAAAPTTAAAPVESTAKVNFDHSFDRSIYMTAEAIQGNVPEVFSMSCTRIAKAIANPVIKAMLIAKLQRPISAETQWAKDAVFALLLSDVTIKLQVIDLHVGDDDPDRKGTPIDADTQRVRFAEPLKVSAAILPTAMQLVKEIANVVTAPVAVNPFQ